MDGYFIALVGIGVKEVEETEMLLPSFSKYTQDLYKETPTAWMGKWLMVNVTDEKILEDLEMIIKIRVRPK